MDYKVHIAFGFHVNLYHSYRGDTNDHLGFGTDIKIIRNTIKVLGLYYSSVPFDSFRTLIPLLPMEHAFNPLWYEYDGERITIIPMISNGDLLDYGSLRYLVKMIHKKQIEGEIKRDALIFINLDADVEFWCGYTASI